MHDHLRTVTARAIRVAVRFESKDGLILLDQFRASNKQRFLRWLGAVNCTTLRPALARLRDVFADPDGRSRAGVDEAADACFDSEDYREGGLAFKEKRLPRF